MGTVGTGANDGINDGTKDHPNDHLRSSSTADQPSIFPLPLSLSDLKRNADSKHEAEFKLNDLVE